MAGYAFSTPISTPSNQSKRYSNHCNRRSTVNSPNGLSMNRNHHLSSPRVSGAKVVKSKNRLKSTLRSEERQMYFKKYLEPSFSELHHNRLKSKTGCDLMPHFHTHPTILNHQMDVQPFYGSSTRPFFPKLQVQNDIMGKDYHLLDAVKCRGLSAISPFKVTYKPLLNGFISSEPTTNDIKPTPKPMEMQTKMNRIKEWNVPEKSHIFKSTIEPKFDFIYQSKQESVVQKNVNNLQESQLVEKFNSLSVIKNDRSSFCSKIKSFLTEKCSFNIRNKLRHFIPFKQQDYEVSDEAHVDRPDEPALPIWTDEMEDELNCILISPNRLLVTAFSINIHTSDIVTLCGHNWLNDSVVEFYFNLITERSQNNPKYPSVYTFGTFFYTRLAKGQALGRWARKLDFFSYDILIIPIISSSHWRLVIVDNNDKRIAYYDSLGGQFRVCVDSIATFLQTESFEKKKQQLDMTQWTIEYSVPGIPLQNNGYDCGVFAGKYAEYIARRAPITFAQEDIPLFRKCMMYEIIHRQLLVS